MKTKTKTFVN